MPYETNLNLNECTRRAFLSRSAGIGSLALASLLSEVRGLRAETVPAMAKPQAKSMICLFQHGGPSQMDLFDPKPALQKFHGKPFPAGAIEAHFDKQVGNVLGSPYAFRANGECGMVISELLPHLGRIADDITLVRSMSTESVDHESALRLIHSGKFLSGLPTIGAWTIYALGTENENLPAYVVLSDPGGLPVDGEKNWTSGWLPAVYQGTVFRSGKSPVLNLQTPDGISPLARKNQLRFLDELNRTHLKRHPENSELAARIANFETAARMQVAVPDVLDLSQETAATKAMYGIGQPATDEYGTRCLIARRLIERGVRFVQLFMAGQPWDTHSKNAESLKGLTARTDQPSAALVQDLKQRGLLDETIVMWTGEFGRLPVSQGADGRDHNRRAFSLWLAGAGFKTGYVHGATDDFSYESIEKVVNVHDLHATLLNQLGLEHESLTYPHEGRDASLTDAEVTHAKVVPELLA
ncbi:MAG: DUF1501 domain-containing protein [Planctomycetes bacterium]|nr:DUF1501 domain-containing protein [Planctomycetota bacterium]